MAHDNSSDLNTKVTTMKGFAKLADYSLVDSLNADPESDPDGNEHHPRQVFSGHYVPVSPTPLPDFEYVAHSNTLFEELGLDDALALTETFQEVFSGDLSNVTAPMLRSGWATGYALSIYGTEYTQQCPFRTGNGYGDGRAMSIFEGVFKGKRWEMQLKGGGRTPYCRGGDGRAVLRSSVREFLAQEAMHALGIPTSRSLSLFVSKTEQVHRPWYHEGSQSTDPEIMVSNPVAISTRVAPSFIRVGQLELFARRARINEHPNALKELEMIVHHLIDREYKGEIDLALSFSKQLIKLAEVFRERLSSLVANWIRVGYCQGNFNGDNCPAGGYTLDYGPFGFCEIFDPAFQPWTGGGRHFSFFNQPLAAQQNFSMFCKSLEPLLQQEPDAHKALLQIRDEFIQVMQQKIEAMWVSKLGLERYDSELVTQLLSLMFSARADFNMFFRELSHIPKDISALTSTFYTEPTEEQLIQWQQWLEQWRVAIHADEKQASISQAMKQVNPKYTWREWLVVPAYQQAEQGNYDLIRELQEVLNNPYQEQSKEIEDKYYRLRPEEFYRMGGVSHYSCSS
ncbi:protein adenylyltransferase SelO [Marinomonas ostreistagni]|uniref:Protein nucleotidyltransferase YdiU n=1 Tax=Marinomonas ostreistagni TaxID=359209 RepID=A0ABS0Z7Q1_9GAMM|nr:protein adenylyltransferase SelO family protein [Marinomonas ostreistagni]MBJ7549680.1 YdiU family protein [Marinomonas ostreistagni]